VALFDIFRRAAKNEPAPVAAAPSGVPSADQDIVSHTGIGQRAEIINFREIVRDGKVPDGAGNHDYSYDPTANDTFNLTLKQIEDNTAQRIAELQRTDDRFAGLMGKTHWTSQDRDKYDAIVSLIISDEVDKYQGFRDYRTTDPALNPNGINDVRDISTINVLSEDLVTGKAMHLFDCGAMSLTKGIVRQRIEDNHDFLPKAGAIDDYKQAMAFHFASGGVSGQSFGLNGRTGGHAFILSPTMQVIEATARGGDSPFRRVTNGTTFEQFANGKPLILADGTVYGGSYDDFGQHQSYRNLAAAVNAGLRDDDRTFTLRQLESRDKIPGFTVALASTADNRTARPDLVMVSSRTRARNDENFEIKIYKIHDVGTAQEG
jgi:hypothetical protein